jgi:nucleoside-diphosphate-sugar epimerase
MENVEKELGWKAKISLREGLKRVYDKAVLNLD